MYYKISDMIKSLNKYYKQEGNIDVCVLTSNDDQIQGFGKSDIDIGTDGEGTLYIMGR